MEKEENDSEEKRRSHFWRELHFDLSGIFLSYEDHGSRSPRIKEFTKEELLLA
jgi:hypothetical protein